MSMTAYEPDWDASTENAWEEIVARSLASSGLCVLCRDDQAMTGDDLCRDCADEIARSIGVDQESAA